MYFYMIKSTLFVVLLCFCRLAFSDIVVVTYLDAPDISKKLAKQIFLKKTDKLPDGTSVTPIDLSDGNALKWQFYKSVAGKKPSQVYAYWSRAVFSGGVNPPEQASSIRDLKNRLLNQQGAIGYMEEGDVPPGMKVLLRIAS